MKKVNLWCLMALALFAGCSAEDHVVNGGFSVTRTNMSGSFLNCAAYNDPCVLSRDGGYLMYFSRNTEDLYRDGRAEPVSIFHATSRDGIVWKISPEEILPLGGPQDWDYNKAETPSVVFFGNKYHLFYSGGNQHDDPVSYSIGHAESDDGIHWTKDGANPLIGRKSFAGESDILHVAEPGAAVIDGKIFLYFTVTRSRNEPNKPSALMELYLACSDDGSHFTQPRKVSIENTRWTADRGFAGFSTPSAIEINSRILLCYDVFCLTDGAIAPFEQVALQMAVSTDGLAFTEDAAACIERTAFDWTKREIRGGNMIHSDGMLKMWFSGDDYAVGKSGWSGGMSIGFALKKYE